MTVFKGGIQKWTLILGTLFLLTYLFQDFLFERMWLLSFILMLLFSVTFIVVFIIGLIKKRKRVIPILIAIISTVAVTEVLKSEAFKSHKILYATLDDDRSAINLTLRENKTFEVNVVTMFSEQNFEGKYNVVNNKIIFLDKHCDNNFIPDTVTIYNDKIILGFDKGNKPITDFATYFDITQNELKNSP
jgi:hypothetical protein